jgi:hypothetical protein
MIINPAKIDAIQTSLARNLLFYCFILLVFLEIDYFQFFTFNERS